MKVLLYSGLLYLTGVAIVLFLRPQLMFEERTGAWKEFGIGRDPGTHTWMPIWLFCILWALVSYLLVIILADSGFLPGLWVSTVEVSRAPGRARAGSGLGTVAAAGAAPAGMRPGYYMLNTEGSGIEGVPKYIYLGPAAPGQD